MLLSGAVDLLLDDGTRQWTVELRPETNRWVNPRAVWHPALVRGPQLITVTGLFGRLISQAQTLETSERGLSAGMFIGNPFTDVLDLATNSFVVANGDETWAAQEALKLAEDFWQVREQLYQPLISMAEALAQAQAQVGLGTTVFVDAADATSSGASGDSNAILRLLIEGDYRGKALIPIVDPPAVAAALKAGIGAQIQVTLGGQLDPRFVPLPVTART